MGMRLVPVRKTTETEGGRKGEREREGDGEIIDFRKDLNIFDSISIFSPIKKRGINGGQRWCHMQVCQSSRLLTEWMHCVYLCTIGTSNNDWAVLIDSPMLGWTLCSTSLHKNSLRNFSLSSSENSINVSQKKITGSSFSVYPFLYRAH